MDAIPNITSKELPTILLIAGGTIVALYFVNNAGSEIGGGVSTGAELAGGGLGIGAIVAAVGLFLL